LIGWMKVDGRYPAARGETMKRPQFRLRTLFVLVSLASLLMAWSAYQLNWIRQRHEFLAERQQGATSPSTWKFPPWSIRIFGERSPDMIFLTNEQDVTEAKSLFPEVLLILKTGGQEVSQSSREVGENTDPNTANHPLPGGGF
jgi:hypothetical protein